MGACPGILPDCTANHCIPIALLMDYAKIRPSEPVPQKLKTKPKCGHLVAMYMLGLFCGRFVLIHTDVKICAVATYAVTARSRREVPDHLYRDCL